ncbi:MAG: NADH-quinone oxidoreductase subunit NuoK [Armatimonadetes bacterium]|nr:MAG: NADH-quinone oxidoreductase subunit NuoK [Armatimonadota bacterium]GIV02854.1 MAG: NADH-quinone oxidoreductase subunit K 2 [Fimbriimonadales bacterium]
MEGIPLYAYLLLSALLFAIGTVGVLIKRNPIIIFMCIELMLNAANLSFLAFAKYHSAPLAAGSLEQWQVHMTGQMAVVFVMAVAAAEVAVGLGIIMAIFRLRHDVDIDEMSTMRG